MGGEDFSFMLNARPGAFIFVGNGDTAKLHHPNYDFNDDVIPVGCSYWARLVETAMPAGVAVLRCVRGVALSGWWKSSPQEVTACVTCVAVSGLGEQSEANEQPVG